MFYFKKSQSMSSELQPYSSIIRLITTTKHSYDWTFNQIVFQILLILSFYIILFLIKFFKTANYIEIYDAVCRLYQTYL